MFFSQSVNNIFKSADEATLEAEKLEQMASKSLQEAHLIGDTAKNLRAEIIQKLYCIKHGSLNPSDHGLIAHETFYASQKLVKCDQQIIDAEAAVRNAEYMAKAAADARIYAANLRKDQKPTNRPLT